MFHLKFKDAADFGLFGTFESVRNHLGLLFFSYTALAQYYYYNGCLSRSIRHPIGPTETPQKKKLITRIWMSKTFLTSSDTISPGCVNLNKTRGFDRNGNVTLHR